MRRLKPVGALILLMFLGGWLKAQEQLSEHPDKMDKLGEMAYSLREQNPDLARRYGREALKIAYRTRDDRQIAYALLYWGNANNMIHPDTAYLAYKASLKSIKTPGNDSLKALIFHNLGAINARVGNRREAIICYDSSMAFARKSNNKDVMAVSQLNNAIFRIEIGDTALALKELHLLEQMPLTEGNRSTKSMAIASIAQYENLSDVERTSLYDSAILLVKDFPGHENELGQLLINKAEGLQANEALPILNQAMELSGAYPLNRLAIWNLKAYALAEQGQTLQALSLLRDSAIVLGKEINNPDWLSTLYDSYAELLSIEGRDKESYRAQKISMQYYQAFQSEKSKEQLSLLMTMLDIKNKDEQIALQAGMLLVQKQKQIRLKLWFSIALLFVLALFLAGMLVLSRQRNKARVLQLEAASRLVALGDRFNESLARELHDTSSLLAMAMANNSSPDIENIRKTISQLSHRLLISPEKEGFEHAIRSLADTYITFFAASVRLYITPPLPLMPDEVQLHLLKMMAEMFQNSIRHAPGKKISLQAYSNEGNLIIVFHDDGPGFSNDHKGSGLGLESLRQRAIVTGAELLLQTGEGKGTTWRISVKLNKMIPRKTVTA